MACALDSGHKWRHRIQRPDAAPWTEAHAREAVARTYEIIGEMVRAGRLNVAAELQETPFNTAQAEDSWRADLSCGLDAARIEREVRRVRGLAEGRLVRETWWRVGLCWYAERARAEQERRDTGAPMFRVTRIRRAP